jgi:brefeldin A-inhibited guanine nucleotide-exchange protein
MLNTDLHNPQIKKRMTRDEFIRNNRGINDHASLPDDYLTAIYESIRTNEIRMKDEQQIESVFNKPGFDLLTEKQKKGAYDEMVQKTEALMQGTLKNKGKRSGQFFTASHAEHVKPMFEVSWMSILAGISGALQESEVFFLVSFRSLFFVPFLCMLSMLRSIFCCFFVCSFLFQDMAVVQLCLEGMKNAIHIACIFYKDLERNAFVSTLAKFTFLNNMTEIKAKNIEAIKALIEIAYTEGNYLNESWNDVLHCISQLERLQLVSAGLESDAIPDLARGVGAR